MKVFVYGTLKDGYSNNRILQAGKAQLLKKTVIKGYKLFNAGFPVATPSDGDAIEGEIWDIGDNEQTLQSLDALEAEGRMYHRREIDEDVYMYVGDEKFWDNFERLGECPRNNDGVFVWGQ